MSSTCGARFSSDGRKILYSGSGEITIKMKYRDKQSISGLAINIEVGGTVWKNLPLPILVEKVVQEEVVQRDIRRRESNKTISVKGASKPNAPAAQKPMQTTNRVFNRQARICW